MATEEEVVAARAVVTLTLSQFKKEMATMGPEAAAAAKDMAKGIQRQLREIEKAAKETSKATATEAKKAAKEAEKAAEAAAKATKKIPSGFAEAAKALNQNQMVSQLETITALGIQAGGAVSQLASVTTSLIRPVALLGTVMGPSAPLVLGLLALPAAGLAAIGMLRGLANAGLEAAERLEEMGHKISPEQRAAYDEYAQSTDRLSIAMDKLKVALGADIADALADVAELTAVMVENFRLAEIVTTNFARGGLFVITLGLSESVRMVMWLTELTGDRLADAYRQNRREVDALVAVQLSHSQALGVAIRVTEEYKKKVHDAMVEGMYWREEQEKMLVALGLMVSVEEEDREKKEALAAATKASAEAERVRGEYLRANEAILGEWQRAQDGAAQQDQKRADELAKRLEDERQYYLDYYRTIQQASREATETEKQESAKRKAEMMSAASAIAAQAQSVLSSFEQLASGNVDYYVQLAAEREAAGKELTAEEQRAASRAWEIQQALAQAQIAIQGIQMGVSFATAMAPLLGPFAIPAGVAAASAFIGAQSALIEQQSPPEFPMGRIPSRSPDHGNVIATRDDEITLSSRGSRALGEETAQALNRGLSLGGGDGPETVSLLRAIRNLLRPARGGGILTASYGRRGGR